MSYFTQMTQLTFHNFVSTAAGMAAAVALVRGIARRSAGRLRNFYVDLVRGTLYLFIPFSLVLALLFVHQGIIQNVHSNVSVTTLEGASRRFPWDRSPVRRRSSSWEPAAAGSSHRIPRTRSRTPRRGPTSCR